MLEFIIKYWVEIFFGLICTIMAALTRHFWKLQKDAIEIHFKKQQEEDHSKIVQEIKEIITERDENLLSKIEQSNEEIKRRSNEAEMHFESLNENLQNLRSGLLSIQGVQFKQECRDLLVQPEITTENWDYITQEWCAYKGLQGNHEGDALYHMIEERYKLGYNK